jgi:hypothetical protein
LLDRGSGMIYDSNLNITWLQDFNYPATSGYDVDGLMTWDDANTWANSLTVGGHDGWRLPTFDPVNPRPTTLTLTNEIGSLWRQLQTGGYIGTNTDITPFTDLPLQSGPFNSAAEWYWTGLEGSYAGDNSNAWIFSMNCACWGSSPKPREVHVTAVHTGDVSAIPPVPEPETYAMLLAGLGLMSFTARRRKDLFV